MTSRLFCVTGLALASGLSLASAQTTINFNGSSPASQFTMASTSFGWNATSGSGATGAFTSGGNAGATYNTGLSTAGFETFQNSVFLKSTGASTGNSSNAAFLGFGDTATSQIITAAAGTNIFGVRLQSTANANELTWQFRYNNGTSQGSGSDTAARITSTTNGSGATFNGTAFTAANTANWFKLSTAFTKSATPNLWTFTASYQDFGSNGLTAGAVLSSITGSFTQASTYTAGTLYASMGARNGYGSVQYSAVDNLSFNAVSAIPEPSTFASLAGLGVLGLAIARRRKA